MSVFIRAFARLELTVGQSVEAHIVERGIQEDGRQRQGAGGIRLVRGVPRRADRQHDVHAQDADDARQVHLSSAELEHGERHARPVDPRPTRHSEIDLVLAPGVVDADFLEDLLQVERQRVVAGPLREHADAQCEGCAAAVAGRGEVLTPGQLLAFELELDGGLDLRVFGRRELGVLVALWIGGLAIILSSYRQGELLPAWYFTKIARASS